MLGLKLVRLKRIALKQSLTQKTKFRLVEFSYKPFSGFFQLFRNCFKKNLVRVFITTFCREKKKGGFRPLDSDSIPAQQQFIFIFL